MEKKIIATSKAPAAIGPYSQAIKIGNFLYTSGQISLDAETMKMVTGSIEIETEKVLQNLEAILVKDGLNLNNVIKTTVYLSDLGDFSKMNQVYERFFSDNRPARACVQVAALPKGAKVEIDAIAHS
ncbi:MAG: RidA family protein [Nitrospinota bacterium]|nr:RidA family protein [Nitrospinota bacterium]MEC9422881.1 RidA family protein [Nitrospinota bacterium]MED5352800.1 RidA family protein [Nitrospinota bacterium]